MNVDDVAKTAALIREAWPVIRPVGRFLLDNGIGQNLTAAAICTAAARVLVWPKARTWLAEHRQHMQRVAELHAHHLPPQEKP